MKLLPSFAVALVALASGWCVGHFRSTTHQGPPILAVEGVNQDKPVTSPKPLLDEPHYKAMIVEGVEENTGNTFDIAIQGQGFFEVRLPNGSFAYTRHGRFRPNAVGQLVLADKFPLQPPVAIPYDTIHVTIDTDGTMSVIAGSNPTQTVIVGNIQIARFQNPFGLCPLGHRLFVQTEASGDPTFGIPGSNGFGTLQQGFLELPNQ